MSFSSDVSSVDFKPEFGSQSIDYSLGDIVRDEKGLLTDDKVNSYENVFVSYHCGFRYFRK